MSLETNKKTRDRDEEIARSLTTWFKTSARDLPWRRTRDPYAIWISEVMLQQTRVETVIPYFARFLDRFPNVHALAKAELDEVLSLWSGLGYYRRARELHACARQVSETHEGVFPAEAEQLRKLRGIGQYTAGAVSSIAFGRQAPLVDGNVARVIARLEALDDDIKSSAGIKSIWATATKLVPREEPGIFNQALMELGATLCVPRDPACLVCPVNKLCSARRQGRERDLPVVGAKRVSPRVLLVVAVVESRGELLFGRRKEGGLFGGLWEAPMVEASTLADARHALEGAGVPRKTELVEAGRVEHVLTHRELDVLVTHARVDRPWVLVEPTTEPYERLAWTRPDEGGIGISTLTKKILAKATGGGPGKKVARSGAAKKKQPG